MDGLLVLLALIVLAIPVTIIILLVGQSRLKSRVSLLEARIAGLSASRPRRPASTRIRRTCAP